MQPMGDVCFLGPPSFFPLPPKLSPLTPTRPPPPPHQVMLILKWGGVLTHAGRQQAEDLGRMFRMVMYPRWGGGGGGEGSAGYEGVLQKGATLPWALIPPFLPHTHDSLPVMPAPLTHDAPPLP